MTDNKISYFTNITKKKLEKDYIECRSIRSLIRKFGGAYKTYKKYFKLFGINVNKFRVNPMDEDFFKNDTEMVFYIAGYIAADGCLMKMKRYHRKFDRYSLAISIKHTDLDHLEKIRDILSPNSKISTVNCNDNLRNSKWKNTITHQLRIGSSIVFNDLAKFCITPRKSLTCTFPKWMIDHPLAHHFIRGYFDGDGSICIDKQHSKRIHIRGTYNFLSAINKIIGANCENISTDRTIAKDSGIYSLQYVGNNSANKIRNYLYNNATIFMQRKKDIFDIIMQNQKQICK